MAETRYVPLNQRAKSKGYGGTPSRTPVRVEELQDQFCAYLAEGYKMREAMAKVGRTTSTYSQWRARYPGFADRCDRIRIKARQAKSKSSALTPDGPIDFGVFRKRYLGHDTFPHQWQWVDLLEGRPPRDLDPAMTYIPGREQRILVNTPPFHAKTATISIDYCTYRICMDPNVRIILISESRDMARKILHAIKDRLTHPKYSALHEEYGPAGGYKIGSSSWTQDLIYVGNRDSGEKDPTVEVLGIGSQIYGARADLIVLDDTVTLKTARTPGQRDKLLQYLDQEVASRLGPQGKLLIVGTRVTPNDAYSTLLKRDREKQTAVWTYLAQPAVLEYEDDPAQWKTLWPHMWDGPALSTRRDEIDSATWNLVYMQQQVAEDQVFPEEAVKGCCYQGNPGPLPDHIRPTGMQGLYVVAGLDPASAGYTAIVVLAVDRRTKIRYVLEVVNQKGCTPHHLRGHIERLQSRYGIHEWRIEKNGLQSMISQDPEVRRLVLGGGARLVEHQTHAGNKWDPGFGVQSLAPLFLGALDVPPRPQIMIPYNGRGKGIEALIDQLVTWEPDTPNKTDTVMALWFAELGCRKVLESLDSRRHVDSRWLTRGQAAQQTTVNLDQLMAERAEGRTSRWN